MDIVLTIDGTCILINTIIANPTHVDIVSQIASSQGVAATIIVEH
jgi:hypothetical protein